MQVTGLVVSFRVLIINWYYLGQLPCVFGLLAPILVISSLGVVNFWCDALPMHPLRHVNAVVACLRCVFELQ